MYEFEGTSWEEYTKRLLKAELKRADVTYRGLAHLLESYGMFETEASIANKISRGSISAALLLASLTAIGCKGLSLGDG
jgi:hypothetical protein